MGVTIGVLGTTAAWDADGDPIPLGGPRQRALLARLAAARGRPVALATLIGDLWEDSPANVTGVVHTYIGALRRALEPERPARGRPRVVVSAGSGYALQLNSCEVDSLLFEDALRPGAGAGTLSLAALEEALSRWRGPAYAEFADEPWTFTERGRLGELRLGAVEARAAEQLRVGRAAQAVPDLEVFVEEHPWREEGWRLLALALYRSGRQHEALKVLRRARALLNDKLGLSPHSVLRALEHDILHQSPGLDQDPALSEAPELVWHRTLSGYGRNSGVGAKGRLRSTVELLRQLAITGGGGLETARRQRLAAVVAADGLADVDLTARVIGAYDVPALWTRSDDPDQAAHILALTERTLAALPPGTHGTLRARLLTTIAVESRGLPGTRGREAAQEAEELARGRNDPALLAFALNGSFLQSFSRSGLAPERASLGSEILELAGQHDLPTSALLGHLIRMQAGAALGEVASADHHAAEADRLAAEYESPLVAVFTTWYRALRMDLTGGAPTEVAAAYRAAAGLLRGAGMPGVEQGALALSLLCLRVRHGRPAPAEDGIDWGPYRPWAEPLVLLARGEGQAALAVLRGVPEPEPTHHRETLWCLIAEAALQLGEEDTMGRAYKELLPAAAEYAGAGSGFCNLGPVSGFLSRLEARRGGRPE
ncbi:SARP family transcriptional regulator [Arthrobacter crusticola]|uniref:SARP family transcriptional regulator n=1 Tax=Arthrobacter crusticola TaxID=2547960 RepID=A0A4R5TVR1_9MICC|nr:BTAD domain-containing putative transcriptional regulator [Arthrobacter crusticola]TDK25206.1 SARP family transcriptional regulator [Arthrobacter crusticola]